jgi:peptide/nickel transport system permease protein
MNNIHYHFKAIYKHSWRFKCSCWFLVALVITGLFAPILASEYPLIVKTEGDLYFPLGEVNKVSFADSSNIKWILNAPIKFSPGKSDFNNAEFIGPFDRQVVFEKGETRNASFFERHILGADLRGADLLSGLIHGIKISLFVGFVSAFLSFIIGVFLGGLAGWFTVSGYKIKVSLLLVLILEILFTANLFLNVEVQFIFKFLYLILFLVVGYFLTFVLKKIPILNNGITLPIDSMERQLNLVFSSFPKTMIILIIAAFMNSSWWNLILLISLTGWMEISRMTRGEFIRISTSTYIDAAKTTGASFIRILTRHFLPNILPSLLTVMIFYIALNILLESSLSFLGIGVPANEVTWGSLLASSRDNFSAWWLVLFPGLILTLTINSLMFIGETLQKKVFEK